MGFWHEKTLLKLKDTIVLYKRPDKREVHVKILELLQVAFIKSSRPHPRSCPCTMLPPYSITASLGQHGLRLVRYFRHWITFGKDSEISTDIILTLEVSVSRTAFIFFVSFEQHPWEKLS